MRSNLHQQLSHFLSARTQIKVDQFRLTYVVLIEDGVYNYLKHKLLLKIERKSLTFRLNSCYKPLFLADNIRPAVDQADTINKPAC